MADGDCIARVLVVEDDPALSDVVTTFLAGEDYDCVPAFSGTEASLLAERAASKNDSPFDLVILDLMLPGVSGEELIGRLRRHLGTVPVIVTSAKAALSDRVGVLRLGANDYLVKPFDLEELLARVEVQLRGHPARRVPSSTALVVGRWSLDPTTHAFAVDDEPLRLTRTEFDLLDALMFQPGRVFTKRELFERVRNEEALSEERTIATHVGNLRTKLRPSGTDTYLETVWGIGFRLHVPE